MSVHFEKIGTVNGHEYAVLLAGRRVGRVRQAYFWTGRRHVPIWQRAIGVGHFVGTAKTRAGAASALLRETRRRGR